MNILKKIYSLKQNLQKSSADIRNLKLWISKKKSNPDCFKDYLRNKKIEKVAIVGNGVFTDILIEELLESEIDILYIIGSTWSVNIYGIPVLSQPEKKVDAIITTSTSKEKYDNYKIISIFDILYNK